jgi:hypothetical protein
VRPLAALCLLVVFLPACHDDGDGETAVVPVSIEVSPNRRTLTVETYYPVSLNCGKEPGGLDVDVGGGVALITAVMKGHDGDCTGECASVTQTVTLDEPLPNDVRFEAPPDADPGCGVPAPPPDD